MEYQLPLVMLPQPDAVSCGPTCLHAVYAYYGHETELDLLRWEVRGYEGGGTAAVFIACHALRYGYRATIYTYNLTLFDPTWLNGLTSEEQRAKLQEQMAVKRSRKLHRTTRAYLEFLARGGVVRFADLRPGLIHRFLRRRVPIITGLSATYLYRTAREGQAGEADDIGGEPVGHFVVLCGYDRSTRTVLVADPFVPNPVAPTQQYVVGVNRLIDAILLGVLTYDANLLILEPGDRAQDGAPAPVSPPHP
ncbi:MAG: hypothetical protein JXR37_13690 [Kiritimatiellae bacterium]|nr:hypothetical protein [Kiritimatiellia bacterium]